ncbi:MAG: UDP-N-acetylmuramate dehydrogenase [Magnetococcales bacterium]|nr:UDP-N-acetylmuramate dehydrogenase [Magnetococcales bacterium]
MGEIRLPASIKPLLTEGVSLRGRTTWRMGGNGRWLAEPVDQAELARIWTQIPETVPLFLLGGGSNILVDDAGFDGVVINLSRHLNQISAIRDNGSLLLTVEAGTSTSCVAHYARRNGWGGAEFLGGIPGTIGGAMRMNAGAHGGEIAHLLVEARLMDKSGRQHCWPVEKLGLEYRRSALPSGWIFISGTLRLKTDDPENIRKKMRQNNQHRRQTQPLDHPSAGSTFKNPPQVAAWRLIDEAGLRGARIGEAQVSEKHSNFLVNRGQAKSRDMRILIETVKERVMKTSGISLQLEVGILGPQGFYNE